MLKSGYVIVLIGTPSYGLNRSIQQLMTVEDVTSVTASPVKECVLVTAQLADGTTKMYIMNKDSEEGSTSMLAIN